MTLTSSALALFLLIIATAAALPAQQSPRRRTPPGYLTGSLSLDPVGESVVALRGGLEIPLGRVLRPWTAAGYWGIAGRGCADIIGPGIPPCDDHVSGTVVETGLDVVPLSAALPVLPFLGVAGGVHWRSNGDVVLGPILRAGLDLQPFPWFAPRAQIEWTRYPVDGTVLLLTGGVRIGVPLR